MHRDLRLRATRQQELRLLVAGKACACRPIQTRHVYNLNQEAQLLRVFLHRGCVQPLHVHPEATHAYLYHEVSVHLWVRDHVCRHEGRVGRQQVAHPGNQHQLRLFEAEEQQTLRVPLRRHEHGAVLTETHGGDLASVVRLMAQHAAGVVVHQHEHRLRGLQEHRHVRVGGVPRC